MDFFQTFVGMEWTMQKYAEHAQIQQYIIRPASDYYSVLSMSPFSNVSRNYKNHVLPFHRYRLQLINAIQNQYLKRQRIFSNQRHKTFCRCRFHIYFRLGRCEHTDKGSDQIWLRSRSIMKQHCPRAPT